MSSGLSFPEAVKSRRPLWAAYQFKELDIDLAPCITGEYACCGVQGTNSILEKQLHDSRADLEGLKAEHAQHMEMMEKEADETRGYA